MIDRDGKPRSDPVTMVYEEALVAKHLPGFRPQEMYASEFGEALEALASILESESPVTGSRDKVEREMRRMGYT